MTVPLAYATLLVSILAAGRWCQLRVEREHTEGGMLSVGTVWLVWTLYAVQVALVAVPAMGAWGSLPGPVLVWRGIGCTLVATGLALAAWGVASFHSFRRMNGRELSELITSGAYRYSRNPQNVGIGAALVGLALLAPSSVALAAAVLFCLMFRIYLPTEERFLESAYGRHYREYLENSHRIFGLPRPHGRGAAA